MKNLLFLTLIIFSTLLSFSQKKSHIETDYIYKGERIDSTNFVKILISLERTYKSVSEKEFQHLLESLIAFKVQNEIQNSRTDTSIIEVFRKCIDYNYKIAESHYNIGATYINFITDYLDKDDHKTISLDKVNTVLNLAEYEFWQGAKHNEKFSYWGVAETSNIRQKYFKTSVPEINLNSDTLRIISFQPDCGEFGGHFEEIIIHKGKSELFADFFCDSIYCQVDPPKNHPSQKFNTKTAPISKESIEDLINYTISYTSDLISNAPFEIAITDNKNVIFKRFEGYDKDYFYFTFRKEIFGF